MPFTIAGFEPEPVQVGVYEVQAPPGSPVPVANFALVTEPAGTILSTVVRLVVDVDTSSIINKSEVVGVVSSGRLGISTAMSLSSFLN